VAETYVSGQGGHVVLEGGLERPITEWRASKSGRLAETTTSKTGGARRKRILKEASGSFSMPWDLDQIPEEVGLEEGAELDAQFDIGESNRCYRPPGGIIIESVEVINNALTDVVRCNVNWHSQGPLGNPVLIT
jgi:hypothetical protein